MYNGIYPFLQFLLIEDEEYSFPTINFKCPLNIPSDGDQEHSPRHIYFENACTSKLLEYVNPEKEENSFEESYKGFFLSKTLENTIYVVFNLNNFELKEVKCTFAITHEIINNHKILDKIISQEAYNLFYEVPELIIIKNKHNEPLPTPHLLYKCIINDNKYSNEIQDDEEYISLIDSKTVHPLLNENFIFSTVPLNKNNLEKRYAVFIIDPIYITENISNVPSKTQPFALGSVIPTIIDYFSKTSKQEKNSKSKEEDEKEESKEDEKEESKEDEKEESTTENEEDSDVEENLYTNLDDISKSDNSVYYHENTEEDEISFWLVKLNTHFIEL